MTSQKQSLRAPVLAQLKASLPEDFEGTFSDMILAILTENRLLKRTLAGQLPDPVSITSAVSSHRPLEVVSVLTAPKSHR